MREKDISLIKNEKYIEQWKACFNSIQSNNLRRNTSNIAFIGLAISSFYIMNGKDFFISEMYVLAVILCCIGWGMTIYGYKKSNDNLYAAIAKIESEWDMQLLSPENTKAFSLINMNIYFQY